VEAAHAGEGRAEPASTPLRADEVLARWPAILPFLVFGTLYTIAGGLVAAVSRPLELGHGSWVAAYLVLAGGVGQIGLGVGQGLVAESRPSRSIVRVEASAWNVGLVGVIVGTLVSSPFATTLGSAVSAVALILFVRTARAPGGPATRARWLVLALAAALLVSTPVGVVLAWARHG